MRISCQYTNWRDLYRRILRPSKELCFRVDFEDHVWSRWIRPLHIIVRVVEPFCEPVKLRSKTFKNMMKKLLEFWFLFSTLFSRIRTKKWIIFAKKWALLCLFKSYNQLYMPKLIKIKRKTNENEITMFSLTKIQ